ncbi:MAG TPA: hypothetical protein VGG89_08650 [Candidatus Baltobacteraceae bacterium]|jgi:tetrahydromethanopterin S-methyltransferase subunit E
MATNKGWRAAARSGMVLAGFGQGLAVYIFAWAIAVGGITIPADLGLGLVAAAVQGMILTAVLSVVILPASFALFWFSRNPVAGFYERLSPKRALLYADALGFIVGILAGLAGVRLPIM